MFARRTLLVPLELLPSASSRWRRIGWRRQFGELVSLRVRLAVGWNDRLTTRQRSDRAAIPYYRHDVIEAQLAHIEPNQVRRAYNRAQYWPERVALMQDWADLCDSLKRPKRTTAI